MPGLLPQPDPNGLLEYSVVFTDRSLNHMSASFQDVMRGLSTTLKQVYSADAVVVVPGGGTFGMESVARQFADGADVLILRNGWFSFRWSQILDHAGIAASEHVMMAQRPEDSPVAPFAPAPLDEVVAEIDARKPGVVFAPHVETSAGLLLPDDYMAAVGEATRRNGGLFVLDCIASGALWVDMRALNVDVLISAPQKGWSGTPCAAQVMLSERAVERMANTRSSSFSADLAKWHSIMQAYEGGGHAYHATMPTDGLVTYRNAMLETEAFGFDAAKSAQIELGRRVRELLAAAGFRSVAADGYGAPGVVVSYTDNADLRTGAAFARIGLQTAAGVPLQCGEGDDFSTFRIGLFGLDKLGDIGRTVGHLERALSELG